MRSNAGDDLHAESCSAPLRVRYRRKSGCAGRAISAAESDLTGRRSSLGFDPQLAARSGCGRGAGGLVKHMESECRNTVPTNPLPLTSI
jgi:hypothetical protein